MYIKTIHDVYKLTVPLPSASKIFKPRMKVFYFLSEADANEFMQKNFAAMETKLETVRAIEDQGKWREVHDIFKYGEAVKPTMHNILDSKLSGILRCNEGYKRIILIGVKPSGEISLTTSDFSHDAKYYIRNNVYILNGVWHPSGTIMVNIDRHTFTLTTPEVRAEFEAAYELPPQQPIPSAPPLKLLN